MKYFLYLYDGIKTGYIDYNENISRIDGLSYLSSHGSISSYVWVKQILVHILKIYPFKLGEGD
jgi:hypothetical protein